jgi:uncharacterized membrane protein YkvI
LAHPKQTNLGWQTFRVAATYVGTVVGAGFASGQETLRFFGAYGQAGLWGIAIATLLFCGYGILVMDLGRRLGARSHREILNYACGPIIGRIMDVAITLLLGATLSVMIAGGGAIFAEQLGFPRVIGAVLTGGLAGWTILRGMRGIMAANAIVVPLLGTAVLGLSLFSIRYHGLHPMLTNASSWPMLAPVNSWLLAALLYVGNNLVLSISVLGPLGAEVKDRRALITGGMLGGLFLGLLAACIKLAVSVHMPEIGRFEVPMLFLARLHPGPIPWFYTIVLWAEIYTTAIACAYGFAARAAEVTRQSYPTTVLVVMIIALFGSGFGFSALVSTVYPISGYVTLVVLLFLSLMSFRRLPTI